jgi:hypothetical protein
MATLGRIVHAWRDAKWAYLSLHVDEDNGESIEYIGRVNLDDLDGLPIVAQRSKLVDAVKLVRQQQLSGYTSLPISGTVPL